MATITAAAIGTGDSLERFRQEFNTLRSDVSNIQSGTLTLTNESNNRIFTSVSSNTMNAESGLTYDGSTFAVSGAVTVSGLTTLSGNLVIPNAGNIGSDGDNDSIAIASNGVVTFSQAVSGTSADFDGGVTIDNITIDGTEIDLSSGDLTVDVDGDIILDADGDNIFLKAAGTTYGDLAQVGGELVVKSGSTPTTAATFSGANVTFSGTITGGGLMTTGGNIVIPNAGNIGSASDTDAIAIASDGVVTFSQVPVFPSDTVETADIQDNAVTLAKMASGTDGNIISYDASGNPVAIATGTDGQVLTSTGAGSPPAFEDAAGGAVAADDVSAGDAAVTLTTSSGNITIDAAANNSDIIFKGTDATSDITMLTLDGSEAGAATFNNAIISGAVITSGAGLLIADAGTIGSASDTDAIAIGSDGDVTLTQDLELQHDGAILSFGANDEVSLTHVHDTGLLLNSTMALQFNDASQYINAPSATILDINATDEIELNATLADVNANLDVSGTYQGGGTMTTGGNIVIPDDGTIGSASDTDAISIDSSGRVIFSGVGPFFTGGNVYQNSNHYHLGYNLITGAYNETENTGFTTYFNADTYVFVRCQDGTTGADCWHMRRNGTYMSAIEENGDFLSKTGSYGTISDERLKEHITDSGSQWNDVKAMRIRKFSFIEDKTDSPTQLGVIAQELEASGMGGLVKTKVKTTVDVEGGPDKPMLDEDGNPTDFKVVKMSILYMKAVKALQEAMTRIETLETKVAILESA